MPRRAEKNTTSDYRRIDVRRWQRDELLAPGSFFTWSWSRDGEQTASIGVVVYSDYVLLTYTYSQYESEPVQLNCAVNLERTPCNYGGVRVWFCCPARGCGRRVAILYGRGLFACRHCLTLGYDSQRQTPHSRALCRAQGVLMKLGGSGSMVEPFPHKPKRMHWRTYHELIDRWENAESASLPPWLLRDWEKYRTRK